MHHHRRRRRRCRRHGHRRHHHHHHQRMSSACITVFCLALLSISLTDPTSLLQKGIHLVLHCPLREIRVALPGYIRHHSSKLAQGSRRDQKDQEITRREVELDRQVSPEEIMSIGRWSWAAKVGLLSLRVVRQQQCNGHCLCDSAQARQLKQQLRSAQVTGQWRGDTALTLPLFWRRSTVSPVFFGRCPRSSLHFFVPLPPVPVPNKPPRFCGRKAKWSKLAVVCGHCLVCDFVPHS